MAIVAVLFWALVPFTLVAIGLGVSGKPRWYWWAALSSYVCSFLSGYTIGLLVLSLTFVLVLLALGHSYRLIRAWWHSAAAAALGVALWWLAVLNIDDYWLFLPFTVLDF
ncbi:hypothetical protein J2Z79_002122 [Symbiobacterium terraclitae]|uniref:Uncharacterized protein n=1 Tax=Symbiobacterium terraclitae TaxID=557451 RepID=A0ABS4JT45_9FIRM|nr:hypothetical protein [Symbiobacterium terraclitae]MBP2018707.1 hypothetical protein [Symbiobacterium terraclitae]